MSFNRELSISMFNANSEEELRSKLYGQWSDLTTVETNCITEKLSEFNSPRYCEIGVYFGGNFLKVYKSLQESKEDFHMYGVDLFENLKAEEQTSQTHDLYNKWNMLNVAVKVELEEALHQRLCHKFTLVKGHSDVAVEGLQEKCDVFFIDGNHTYEQTMLDAKACISSSKVGSYLIFHNASKNIQPDPQYVLRDGGPHLVVENLCKLDNVEFVESAERCSVVRVLSV